MIDDTTAAAIDPSAIDAYSATWISIGLLTFLLLCVPILERIPRFGACISRRWIIVVFFTVMAFAVIIDFTHLDTATRNAVVIGGIILGGLFVVLRSIEKALANGWGISAKKIEASAGDKSLTLEGVEVGKQDKKEVEG